MLRLSDERVWICHGPADFRCGLGRRTAHRARGRGPRGTRLAARAAGTARSGCDEGARAERCIDAAVRMGLDVDRRRGGARLSHRVERRVRIRGVRSRCGACEACVAGGSACFGSGRSAGDARHRGTGVGARGDRHPLRRQPGDQPVEVGLEYTVDLDKDAPFIGQDALRRIADGTTRGVTRSRSRSMARTRPNSRRSGRSRRPATASRSASCGKPGTRTRWNGTPETRCSTSRRRSIPGSRCSRRRSPLTATVVSRPLVPEAATEPLRD